MCRPEYSVGTYTIEDKTLTIQFSGNDQQITGVMPADSNASLIIDGVETELRTDPYWTEGEDESWKSLDETIGLE